MPLGDGLDVRALFPDGKGQTFEVLSVDAHTTPPVAPLRASFRKATSGGPSSGTPVGETGAVKWFNVDNGFGFIVRDSGGKDVFVHISALAPSGVTALNEGDRVIVDIARGRKGLEAARVRLV